MSRLIRQFGPVAVFGLMVIGMVGCGTVGQSVGITPPSNPLLPVTKAIRDAAPVPAPGGRELAKELLPTHLVQPGDTLLVQPVELDAPVRLPPDQLVQMDGTIDLGVYGRPVVAGRTLAQIETQLKEIIKAQDKGKGFAVTVRLIGRPGTVFYVLGEVNAPGAFPLTGRETVLDGIIAAGGVTRRASLGNIVLARPTAPDGCRIVFPVCYQQITQLGDTTTNYQLQPGDRVFVPSKSMLESIMPQKCQTPAAACSRPQIPCFGGACAPGPGPGTGMMTIPHAPPVPLGMPSSLASPVSSMTPAPLAAPAPLGQTRCFGGACTADPGPGMGLGTVPPVPSLPDPAAVPVSSASPVPSTPPIPLAAPVPLGQIRCFGGACAADPGPGTGPIPIPPVPSLPDPSPVPSSGKLTLPDPSPVPLGGNK